MDKASILLDDREKRSYLQKELMSDNSCLVVIKANYPGVDKNNFSVSYVVFKGYLALSKVLDIKSYQASLTLEGLIIYLSTANNLEDAKQKAITIEDTRLGRLLDIDVFQNNKQISRNDLNIKARKCFLCTKDAKVCTRARTHEIKDVIRYFEDVVKDDIKNNIYSNLVIYGLIGELCKNKTFGTVTILSNGSHNDMTYQTFFASIKSLAKSFERFSEIDTSNFISLRTFGLEVESAMFSATNGINTHKGAIFTYILILAGYKNTKNFSSIVSEVRRLSRDIYSDFSNKDLIETFTMQQYKLNKLAGIRGLAYTGYQVVFEKILARCSSNFDIDKVMLKIILEIEDTTIIKRGGFEKYTILLNMIRDEKTIDLIEKYCLNNKLSCGGSADILALIISLKMLKEIELTKLD